VRNFFLIFLSIFILAGCVSTGGNKPPSRSGVMSKELPLTLVDLAEIRKGEKNNIEVVMEEYSLYESPKLLTYLNAITASIAEVSMRPHLPYHVVLLDSDEVNIFGGPGGYIYITRGLLHFVESESEIAGIIAHEVSHIAAREYAEVLPKKESKKRKLYNALLKGSEIARDSVGTYGTVFNYGLRGLEKAAPLLSKRFKHLS